MKQSYFVGVDGGATKTLVRVEDADGNLVGQQIVGPANIRLSVEEAWMAIQSAITTILHDKHIAAINLHVGMGLAGCEVPEALTAFLNFPHSFTTLRVSSDSHTACLGAHQGKDGAILVAGTGVVGFLMQQEKMIKIGGWGFPHDDEGGGAWLGLAATRAVLKWLDGREQPSGLTQALYAHFNKKREAIVSWANGANSTAFATLAPIVVEQAALGDEAAEALLKKAAQYLNQIWDALLLSVAKKNKNIPCALIGSITPHLKPYLAPHLIAQLHPCELTPERGAILLVKNYLDNRGKSHD